jgi:hypothetical protein
MAKHDHAMAGRNRLRRDGEVPLAQRQKLRSDQSSDGGGQLVMPMMAMSFQMLPPKTAATIRIKKKVGKTINASVARINRLSTCLPK